jgi:hypothetical protein
MIENRNLFAPEGHMKRVSEMVRAHSSLVAMAVFLAVMPFTPGCFCVEDPTTGLGDSISQEYEGYMLVESESSRSVLFKLSGLWERGPEGIEGVITLPGDTTEYILEDLELEGGMLSFTATIPAVSNLPLFFQTSFDTRFLTGTITRTGGTVLGPLISVSVGDMPRTEFDMVGAYELVTVSTGGDTLAAGDSVSVRLEFNRDGTFEAISQLRLDIEPVLVVETGTYRVLEDYLVITREGEGGDVDVQLPISIRGYVVNKDLYILSSPRPFPGFDAFIQVADGIQVEHFKQVI